MGCGKNGTFDKHPDWQQWGILAVNKMPMDDSSIIKEELITQLYGAFIGRWVRLFNCETWTIFLTPIEGHGSWDGKNPFGNMSKKWTMMVPLLY